MHFILDKIKENTELIVKTVNENKSILDLKPSIDEWSIIEIVDHLFKIDTNILHNVLLNKSTENVADSNEAFGFDKMYHILVNKRINKYESPNQFTPLLTYLEYDVHINEFSKRRSEILTFVVNNPKIIDNYTFQHPRLGFLTRIDWLNFLYCHSVRHFYQMNEILELINRKG